MGNFQENQIPVQPFVDGLFDPSENVRQGAQQGLSKYAAENPAGLDVEFLIDSLKGRENNIVLSVLKILAALAGASSAALRERLHREIIAQMQNSDSELRDGVAALVVSMGIDFPAPVTKILLEQPEVKTFIGQGVIARTIGTIASQVGESVTIVLVATSTDPGPKGTNALQALEVLSELNPKLVPVPPITKALAEGSTSKQRRTAARIIQNLSESQGPQMKAVAPILAKALGDSDASVRTAVIKVFFSMARSSPATVPIKPILALASDPESSVREAVIKIVGLCGDALLEESMKLLLKALDDAEWSVQHAATEALGNLAGKSDPAFVVGIVKGMLKNPSKWTRLKALEVLISLAERNAQIIPMSEVIELQKRPNEEVEFRAQAAKLLGIVGSQNLAQVLKACQPILQDPEERVRDGMISGLVLMSGTVKMEELLPVLLRLLSDETPMTLQRPVALLLKRIMKYEAPERKKRVISLLKTRCEMSQDRVICDALSELSA
jgi:HEAT repeat protein